MARIEGRLGRIRCRVVATLVTDQRVGFVLAPDEDISVEVPDGQYRIDVTDWTSETYVVSIHGTVSPDEIVNDRLPLTGLRIGCVGDSFTSGENGVPEYLGVASVMCRTMGAICVPSFMTGTGYVSPGQGGRVIFGDHGRLDRVLAANPDVMFFFGSVNDRTSTPNGPAVAAAARKAYEYVWSKQPDIPIIVAGIQPTQWDATFSGNTSSINQAMRSLVDILHEDHPIAYIDQVGTSVVNASRFAPGTDYSEGDVVYDAGVGYRFLAKWRGSAIADAPVIRVSVCFTGTGSIAAPKGDGNRDVYLHNDGTHPTWSGSEAYGHELASLFPAAFASTFRRLPRTEHEVEPPAPPAGPFRDEPHIAGYNGHYWDEDNVTSSVARLRKAVADGADGFTFWVRKTSDDVLVLSEPNSVPVTEGASPGINNTSFADIRAAKTAGGPIATLAEGFALCKELNVGCVVLNAVKFPSAGDQSWNVSIENAIAQLAKDTFGDDASKYVRFYTGIADNGGRTRYSASLPTAKHVVHYHQDGLAATAPPDGSIVSVLCTLSSASRTTLASYKKPMWYTGVANAELAKSARTLGIDWKGFTFRTRPSLAALPPA